MSTLRLLVAGVMVVVLSADARAEKKPEKNENAALLVGSWEVTKAEKESPLAVGTIIEFGKEGKVTSTLRKDEKDIVHQGISKIDGDKLVVTFKTEKGVSENAMTIKKITDSELVIAMADGGSVIEFKRKK